jgi:hypothetical protein
MDIAPRAMVRIVGTAVKNRIFFFKKTKQEIFVHLGASSWFKCANAVR